MERNQNYICDYQFEKSVCKDSNFNSLMKKIDVKNLDLNQISRLLMNDGPLDLLSLISDKNLQPQNPLEKVNQNLNICEKELKSFYKINKKPQTPNFEEKNLYQVNNPEEDECDMRYIEQFCSNEDSCSIYSNNAVAPSKNFIQHDYISLKNEDESALINGENFIQLFQCPSLSNRPITLNASNYNITANKEPLIDISKFVPRENIVSNFLDNSKYQSPINISQNLNNEVNSSLLNNICVSNRNNINHQTVKNPNLPYLQNNSVPKRLNKAVINGPSKPRPFFSNTAFKKFEGNKTSKIQAKPRSPKYLAAAANKAQPEVINLDEILSEESKSKSPKDSDCMLNQNHDDLSIISSETEEQKNKSQTASKRICKANRRYINEYSSSDYEVGTQRMKTRSTKKKSKYNFVVKKKATQIKSKAKLSNSEINEETDQLKCKLCDRMFSRQGLGGHMSRAHPGLSVDYQKKKETRKNREQKLEVLRLAQKVYRSRNDNKGLKGIEMNRTKLNKIREEIMQFYNQYPGCAFPME